MIPCEASPIPPSVSPSATPANKTSLPPPFTAKASRTRQLRRATGTCGYQSCRAPTNDLLRITSRDGDGVVALGGIQPPVSASGNPFAISAIHCAASIICCACAINEGVPRIAITGGAVLENTFLAFVVSRMFFTMLKRAF
jgi:hypothetical protein